MEKIVQPKDQIIGLLEQNHKEIIAYGVRRIGLFGSFLQGTIHEQSDIDLLVEFLPEQKTFDNFMQLSFFLEKLFERQVELVTPESLSPYIGPRILENVVYVAFS